MALTTKDGAVVIRIKQARYGIVFKLNDTISYAYVLIATAS